MFTDESTFTQFNAYVPYVRRPVGTRHDTRYCVSSAKQSAKVMVWGAFSGKRGRAGLWFMPQGTTMNSRVYREVLEDHLLPFMTIHDTEYLLQDGAPCHSAKSTQDWLASHDVQVIGPWPGSSADLNPIENLWVTMKRKVAERNSTSFASLKEAIKEVWTREIPKEECRKLARSMPDRIRAVIEKKGLHTRF